MRLAEMLVAGGFSIFFAWLGAWGYTELYPEDYHPGKEGFVIITWLSSFVMAAMFFRA